MFEYSYVGSDAYCFQRKIIIRSSSKCVNFRNKCQVSIRDKCHLTPERLTAFAFHLSDLYDDPDINRE